MQRLLLSIIGFYLVLLGFTWLYLVLLGFTGFYRVFASISANFTRKNTSGETFPEFDWVLLGSSLFDRQEPTESIYT